MNVWNQDRTKGSRTATFSKWTGRFKRSWKQKIAEGVFEIISVQVPTSLNMQNKLIIHSRYCFEEQYVYPRESNIYMANLYLRDE